MICKPRRFLFWMLLSFGLLSAVSALFAAYGPRPLSMGGTGETSAYAVFLTALYGLDLACLCLIGGMKRQPGFPAAFAAIAGLMLAFPDWWGAPYYGLALLWEGGAGSLRLLAGGNFLLGALGFLLGLALRKRGFGEPARRPQVPSLLDTDESPHE